MQEADIVSKLATINVNDTKSLNTLFEGELDTIRGYLHSNESQLGRSLVVNLDADIKNNVRMVDQRTITFIIIRNIKYYLKTGKATTN